MQRLTQVDPATATGRAKELLDGVEAAFGKAPNGTLAMAVNPAVLERAAAPASRRTRRSRRRSGLRGP
jgi:hypothetical protein